MRIIVFLLAAAVVSGPAAAQSWQDYSYPEYAFSVAFPATPNVETTTYQAANGRSVPARVYSVHQGNELLKVTVADLANTGLDEPAVIDHAIKMLSAGGVVTFNIPQRIYRVYGRSLGIQGGDGSRSMVGVFDYHGRLYQIEAKALPGGSAAATLRFQQSLVFTDGGSNRSEEEIRAFRQGCPGPVGNPAWPGRSTVCPAGAITAVVTGWRPRASEKRPGPRRERLPPARCRPRLNGTASALTLGFALNPDNREELNRGLEMLRKVGGTQLSYIH